MESARAITKQAQRGREWNGESNQAMVVSVPNRERVSGQMRCVGCAGIQNRRGAIVEWLSAENGLTLRQALVSFAPAEYRQLATTYQVAEARFPSGDQEVANVAGVLWSGSSERLVRKEVIAYGRVQGEPQTRLIDPGFFTGADPDFVKDTVTGTDGLVFYSIRIAAAPTQRSPLIRLSRSRRRLSRGKVGVHRSMTGRLSGASSHEACSAVNI